MKATIDTTSCIYHLTRVKRETRETTNKQKQHQHLNLPVKSLINSQLNNPLIYASCPQF